MDWRERGRCIFSFDQLDITHSCSRLLPVGNIYLESHWTKQRKKGERGGGGVEAYKTVGEEGEIVISGETDF